LQEFLSLLGHNGQRSGEQTLASQNVLEVVDFDEFMKLRLENDLGEQFLIGATLINQQGFTTAVEFNKCSKKLMINVTLRSRKGIEFDKHENTYELRIVGLLLVVGEGHFKDGLDFISFIWFDGRVECGFLSTEFELAIRVKDVFERKMSWERESH
jgi:hypothetical protein